MPRKRARKSAGADITAVVASEEQIVPTETSQQGLAAQKRESPTFSQQQESVPEQQEIPVFCEPLPLDRFLAAGHNCNMGNWTSFELRQLYDVIKTYGVSEVAIEYICTRVHDRTQAEVRDKIKEIQYFIMEHRTDRMNAQYGYWAEIGAENIKIPESAPAVGTWSAYISHIIRQRKRLSHTSVSEEIARAFADIPVPKENVSYPVTDARLSLSFQQKSDVSWEKVKNFIVGMVTGRLPLPGLNGLEASIVLSLLDDLEDESLSTPLDELAIYRGWQRNIALQDLRDFEPNVPCSAKNVAQVLLDPLRTRLSDVPLGGTLWCDKVLQKTEPDDVSMYESTPTAAGSLPAAEGPSGSGVAGDAASQAEGTRKGKPALPMPMHNPVAASRPASAFAALGAPPSIDNRLEQGRPPSRPRTAEPPIVSDPTTKSNYMDL